MIRSCIVVCVCLCVSAQTHPSAREELQHLQKESLAARQSGDKQTRIRKLEQIRALVNDAPNVLDRLAQAYASVGNTAKANEIVYEMAEMGECDQEWLKTAEISDLGQHLGRVRRNCDPVSTSATAFTLSHPGLLAEDIAYDTANRTFLITSVLGQKIVRADAAGKLTDFASSPSGWPMLGIKIDQKQRVVWATEVALDGFANVPKQDWGRSAVLAFNLADGTLRLRIEVPRPSAIGDIALLQDGGILASDGVSGALYRVAAAKSQGNTLRRIDHGEFISSQTAVIAADGRYAFVPDYVRGVARVDLDSGAVSWLDSQHRYALSGIDGLYLSGNSLFATQNGVTPERVMRFQLDGASHSIVGQQVVERATPTLGDPTHGVVVGRDFYYIANSGWSEIDDHGNLKPGHKLTAARVMRIQVAQ